MTRSESRQALSLLVGIPGQQSQEKTAGCVSGSELLKLAAPLEVAESIPAAVGGLSKAWGAVRGLFGGARAVAPGLETAAQGAGEARGLWSGAKSLFGSANSGVITHALPGMENTAKVVAPAMGTATKAVEGAAPAVEGAATTAGQVAAKLPWGHRMLGTNRFMRPLNFLNMASTGFSAGLLSDWDRQVHNAGDYGAAQAIEKMRNMNAWDRLGMGWMPRQDLTAQIAKANPQVANQFEGLNYQADKPPGTWENLKHVLFS